jgi:CHAD domain-containing protein
MDTLKTERAEEQSKVYHEVSSGIMMPILFHLLIWINSAFELENPKLKNPLIDLSFEDFTKKRFESLTEKAEINLKKTDFTDLKAIHALRIQFKKLRYASSILEPFLHLASKDKTEELKSLQDRLGMVCDAQRDLIVLKELISKYNISALDHECGILEGYQIRSADEKILEIQKI